MNRPGREFKERQTTKTTRRKYGNVKAKEKILNKFRVNLLYHTFQTAAPQLTFSLMVVSFCIKEPLDFTRVHQIELKFSKFPEEAPHTPLMGGGDPLPYLPLRQLRRRQKALCAFFSRLNFSANRQTNFLATTLGISKRGNL